MRNHLLARKAAGLLAVLGSIGLAACGHAGPRAPDRTPSAASVPIHTETWAYDDSATRHWCDGGYGAKPALVRRWLTFAETSCGPRDKKALRDCHAGRLRDCTVVQYLDDNRAWPRNPIRQADSGERWWLHQPGHTSSKHRLSEHVPSVGTAYWVDQANKQVRAWTRHYVRSNYGAWDGLMLDDTGACLRTQFYGSGYRKSAEIRTDDAVRDEHAALARQLTHADGKPYLQIDNGIQPNPYVCPTLPLLSSRLSVSGLISEGNPWDDGFSPFYSSLLDEIAAVDSMPQKFIVLLSYGSRGSAQARRVQEATVLLGYSPGHVVSWADLEQRNKHLAVWPEEGIYPTDPVQSMTAPKGAGCLKGSGKVCALGGHNDLRVADGRKNQDAAAGVYRREFAVCYDQGIPFGPCAAIVNDTSRPVVVKSAWLTIPYHHEITFKGGDVQSKGRLDLTGKRFLPGQTKIPADGALLLSL